LLLSAFAGVLADRVNQRKLLMVTQGSMGVLAAGLGALVLTGSAELWHVYFFAFLLGIASAFDAPARQTFVAELVPAEGIANAVALNSASFNTARLIGPGISGLLIALVGPGWVFMVMRSHSWPRSEQSWPCGSTNSTGCRGRPKPRGSCVRAWLTCVTAATSCSSWW